MKFYILKMNLYGIKNIDKEIELNFYRKTLQKKFDLDGYNVKAIYGANGSGKTAIIYAVEIYKKFVLDPDYISLHNKNGSLEKIVNQHTGKLKIEMTFVVLDEDNNVNAIYSHYVCFEKKDGRYVVEGESLKVLNGLRLNSEDKWKTIFNTSGGKFVELSDEEESRDILLDVTKNLLIERSVEAILINNYDKIRHTKTTDAILQVFHFAQILTVLINESDKNYININEVFKNIKTISRYGEVYEEEIFNQLLMRENLVSDDTVSIRKEDFNAYEKTVENLCRFLQVFKSDLVRINIDKKEVEDYYKCEMILEYDDGKRISKAYESTGIKKFINLYYALCNENNGGIVFIDEFDANIHDIVLIKLVEYIKEYSKGQFVFTTHNLGPMEVLQKEKMSIDFLSNDSRITPWVKTGNNSAVSVYRRGLIKYSPFNIEPFNFLGVFDNESD